MDLARPDSGTAPTRVWVALYLADLDDISASEQTFFADVVLRAEWQDPRLAGRWPGVHGVPLDDVWNPRLQLVNQRGVTVALPQRVTVDPDGHVTYRQRYWGRFSTRMNLADFPLDHHRFHIQVVSLGHSTQEVELALDAKGVRSGRAAQLSLTDWKVGPAWIARADFKPGPGDPPLAGVALYWEASRYFHYHAVQVILPLVLIVLMGGTSFWPDPTALAPRVSLAMTTMLTLIAYRFALGRSVPTLTYLTRFDWFMLASTILVFLVVVVVGLNARLIARDKRQLVDRIDLSASIAFPLVFAVVFVLAWWG
jgi:hypothetical protein